MKEFNDEEKSIVLDAIGNYIDHLEHAKRLLTEHEEIVEALGKLYSIRKDLILDLTPIVIKENIGGREKQPCPLCGYNDRPETPEWAFIDNKPICEICFHKYLPVEFEAVREKNYKFWNKDLDNVRNGTR